MLNNNSLKSKLIRLADLRINLDKKGGPQEDTELFEEILELQDGILMSFGLSLNPDNEKLLELDKLPIDFELDEIINQLKTNATDYLLSDAKTELQILRDARELNQDASYLLPELKIRTHTYTIFLYEKVFLKDKERVEDILQELRLVENTPEVLNALGALDNSEDKRSAESQELIKFITDSGVKYLRKFINSK